MENVFCFKHPKYDKKSAPDLSCKTCCRHYVDFIVQRQKELKAAAAFDTQEFAQEQAVRKNAVPEVLV